MTIRRVFRNHTLIHAAGSSWHSRLPPPTDDGSCAAEADANGEDDGEADSRAAQTQEVIRRMLPRSATVELDAIAEKLEWLAERASGAGDWGFRVCRGTHCTGEQPQFMRYVAGGFTPLHRDTFGTPSWLIGESEAVEWDVEHPDGMLNFTQVSRRIVSVLVQLTSPAAYTGGQLQLYSGTRAEPALAQRAASSNGRMIVNAVRRNASVIAAPTCVGDVIIFVGLVPHDVTSVESGARESFAWWVHGSVPDSGAYAARTPWIDPRRGQLWEVTELVVTGNRQNRNGDDIKL